MHLSTLGGLTLDGASFTRPKPLLLLAYLALEGTKERRYLAEFFWMGAPDPRNNLGSAIAQLRKGAPGAILADTSRVWTTVVCDAHELLGAVEQGALERAHELYRGPFLHGVDPAGVGIELEEWIYGTREYLATLARKALLTLAEETAGHGDFERAAALAEAVHLMSEASPAEPEELERVHRLLAAGKNPRIGKVREEAREYGLEIHLTHEAARAELERTELGRPTHPNNLPPEATPFVGRSAEEREIAAELSLDACRVLTLLGAGGVGKTRLALRHARSRLHDEHYRDGVHFVPLQALTRPDQVPGRIAETIGIELREDDPLEGLKLRLESKRMLLVLDNFEQLVDGAEFVSGLVTGCPGLKLLVTSRERLNIAEEWVYPLQGLAYPETAAGPDEVLNAEAAQLFVQHARRSDPHFTAIPEQIAPLLRICTLTGGFPLGLELAAVWVKLMPLEEIADEMANSLDFLASPLRNVSERHRSLRAAFESSWQRLTSRERDVFMRLAVFRGGFSRHAAGRVANATLPLLATLVDRSLIAASEEGRYAVHELLRQFAGDKLAADETRTAETEAAHAHYFAGFLESLEEDLYGTRQKEALDEIAAELDNVRTAWEWAVRQADEACLRGSATSFFEFCDARGQVREGAESFRRAVARVRGLADTAVGKEIDVLLARLLLRKARLMSRLDKRTTLALLSEAEELLSPVRHRFPAEYADVLMWRGMDHFLSGNLDQGMNDLSASDLYAIESGEDHVLGGASLAAGQMLEMKGEYRAAVPYLQRSNEALISTGDRRYRSYALNNWGRAAYGMGRYEQAERLLDEALALRQDLDETVGIVFSRCDRGNLARMRGNYDAARNELHEGLELSERTGLKRGTILCLQGLGSLALALGDLDAARNWHRRGLDLLRTTHQEHHHAVALNGLARVAYLEGDFEGAWILLRESLETSERFGNTRDRAYALRLLGSVSHALHPTNPEEASGHFRSALSICQRTGAAPQALDVLLAWAEAGAEGREIAWLTLIEHDARSEFETRQGAQQLLAQLKHPTPLGRAETAAAEGRDLRLWDLVADLVSRQDS